ncbi:MAG: hypothetical protein JRJ87_14695 [Deltaproteobacteria bacterium]|nr:hypothetical protein [Deltaproteobacteria bacterium]
MKKATIFVLIALFSMIPVFTAMADATGANYLLVIDKSNLDSHIADQVSHVLTIEFSKELKEVISDDDIKMRLRFEERINLGIATESKATSALPSPHLKLLCTVDRTKKRTGQRWKGDYFIKVEVIEVATKKKLFEEIVNLGPGGKQDKLDSSTYVDGCRRIAKKVVARLKKMPTPVKGKDGPISPLPKRFLRKLDAVVNCGHGKLSGMERLGRYYIEGAGLILKNTDSSCLTLLDQVEAYLQKNKKKTETILKASRAQILSVDPKKILACRRQIQDRVYSVSLDYLKRCKDHHTQLFKALGVLIYPEAYPR